MAAVVTGFIEVFRDMGTASAVIQRKDPSDALLSSIFWINAVFGCAGMVVLLLISPLFGAFYHNPSVVPILNLLAISFPLSGLGILQQAWLERQLAFQTLAKIEILSAVAASAVGIGSALQGFGASSLVYQNLAGVLLNTALLWWCTRWRPKFVFSWVETRSVSRFSLNLTGFNLLNYFARTADNFLIGGYLGAEALGYYDLSYRLMVYPLQGISAVIGRVTFPIYSKMNDNLESFRRAYLSIAWAIAFVSFPMMLGLMAVAPRLVPTLFGEKWHPVVGLLLILAPLGAVQSVMTTVGGIFQARGRTDWLFRWEMGAATVLTTAFVIGLRWGVQGVATAYAIAFSTLVFPSLRLSFGLIGLRVRQLGEVLWRIAVCSLLMTAVVLLVSRVNLLQFAGDTTVLLVQVAIGVVCYTGLTWIVNRSQMMTLWSLLRGSTHADA
jgi:PST family polysaccharide transporter